MQMPDFTQNFNRYSYALNNPLKFTDPSGNKLKWWQGLTQSHIAKQIGVNKSTISRELRRNADMRNGKYDAELGLVYKISK